MSSRSRVTLSDQETLLLLSCTPGKQKRRSSSASPKIKSAAGVSLPTQPASPPPAKRIPAKKEPVKKNPKELQGGPAASTATRRGGPRKTVQPITKAENRTNTPATPPKANDGGDAPSAEKSRTSQKPNAPNARGKLSKNSANGNADDDDVNEAVVKTLPVPPHRTSAAGKGVDAVVRGTFSAAEARRLLLQSEEESSSESNESSEESTDDEEEEEEASRTPPPPRKTKKIAPSAGRKVGPRQKKEMSGSRPRSEGGEASETTVDVETYAASNPLWLALVQRVPLGAEPLSTATSSAAQRVTTMSRSTASLAEANALLEELSAPKAGKKRPRNDDVVALPCEATAAAGEEGVVVADVYRPLQELLLREWTSGNTAFLLQFFASHPSAVCDPHFWAEGNEDSEEEEEGLTRAPTPVSSSSLSRQERFAEAQRSGVLSRAVRLHWLRIAILSLLLLDETAAGRARARVVHTGEGAPRQDDNDEEAEEELAELYLLLANCPWGLLRFSSQSLTSLTEHPYRTLFSRAQEEAARAGNEEEVDGSAKHPQPSSLWNLPRAGASGKPTKVLKKVENEENAVFDVTKRSSPLDSMTSSCVAAVTGLQTALLYTLEALQEKLSRRLSTFPSLSGSPPPQRREVPSHVQTLGDDRIHSKEESSAGLVVRRLVELPANAVLWSAQDFRLVLRELLAVHEQICHDILSTTLRSTEDETSPSSSWRRRKRRRIEAAILGSSNPSEGVSVSSWGVTASRGCLLPPSDGAALRMPEAVLRDPAQQKASEEVLPEEEDSGACHASVVPVFGTPNGERGAVEEVRESSQPPPASVIGDPRGADLDTQTTPVTTTRTIHGAKSAEKERDSTVTPVPSKSVHRSPPPPPTPPPPSPSVTSQESATRSPPVKASLLALRSKLTQGPLRSATPPPPPPPPPPPVDVERQKVEAFEAAAAAAAVVRPARLSSPTTGEALTEPPLPTFPTFLAGASPLPDPSASPVKFQKSETTSSGVWWNTRPGGAPLPPPPPSAIVPSTLGHQLFGLRVSPNRTSPPYGSSGAPLVQRRRAFTVEEDDAIIKGVRLFAAVGPSSFNQIYAMFPTVWQPGRTITQLYDHWRGKLRRQVTSNSE